jgi:SAM-dependent methyltransferase
MRKEKNVLTFAMNRFAGWWRGLRKLAGNGALFRKPEQQGTEPADGFPEFFHELRTQQLKKVPNEGAMVLSAGCAGSWYFDWFRQSYTGTIRRHIGIDAYSPRPPDLPSEAIWIANSVQDMNGVEDGEVDLIFAGQMIEHLWPLEFIGLLSEAHRVLRPGGRLVMDSPNRDITTALRWSHREHIIEYTTSEISEILEVAGFDVVSIRGLWLCRSNGRVLSLFSPEDQSQRTRRIADADQKPEDSFSWWVEALRAPRLPKRAELASRVGGVCAVNRPWQFREFRRQIGKVMGTDAHKKVVTGRGESGFIHYGPYLPFPPGRHDLTFSLSTPEPILSETTACVLDVTHDSGVTLVAKHEIRCCDLDCTTKNWQFQFDLDNTYFGVEYRVRTTGALPVTLELPIKVRTIASGCIEPTDWTPLTVNEFCLNNV